MWMESVKVQLKGHLRKSWFLLKGNFTDFQLSSYDSSLFVNGIKLPKITLCLSGDVTWRSFQVQMMSFGGNDAMTLALKKPLQMGFSGRSREMTRTHGWSDFLMVSFICSVLRSFYCFVK